MDTLKAESSPRSKSPSPKNDVRRMSSIESFDADEVYCKTHEVRLGFDLSVSFGKCSLINVTNFILFLSITGGRETSTENSSWEEDWIFGYPLRIRLHVRFCCVVCLAVT